MFQKESDRKKEKAMEFMMRKTKGPSMWYELDPPSESSTSHSTTVTIFWCFSIFCGLHVCPPTKTVCWT